MSLDLTVGWSFLRALTESRIAEDPAMFDKLVWDSFNVNVVGNIHLLNIFTPLIKKGNLKKVVVISSGMGDVEFVADVGVRTQTPYAISKAALNMVVAKYHVQYKNQGILFMAISPGLVETGGYDSMESESWSLYGLDPTF